MAVGNVFFSDPVWPLNFLSYPPLSTRSFSGLRWCSSSSLLCLNQSQCSYFKDRKEVFSSQTLIKALTTCIFMASAFSTVQCPVPRKCWRTVVFVSLSQAWRHRIESLLELKQTFHMWGSCIHFTCETFFKSTYPLKFYSGDWAAVQAPVYLKSLRFITFPTSMVEDPDNFWLLSLHNLLPLLWVQKELTVGSKETWVFFMWPPECSELLEI